MTEMTSDETIAFLEAHNDECFAVAKKLASAISYENGAELNALRLMPLIKPLLEVITAADVIAFLTAQAAKLASACGQNYVFIGCEVGNPSHGQKVPTISWKTYVAGDIHRSAPDHEIAMQNAISGAAPAALVKSKREQAEKLLAEADALMAKVPSQVEQPANASS